MSFLELISSFMLFSGAFFFLVGDIGLLRMPDLFCRMHATTKCDTLGISLILGGIILLEGFSSASLKLIMIIFFIWITAPTAAHALAKAGYDTQAEHKDKIPFLDFNGVKNND